mmetsp:Transcript_103990/g.175919  ORF Transcript_103990/g.175919 Transcript_103990/m.175919 type:complete len:99 (+) Transcript_103990:2-298(+)
MVIVAPADVMVSRVLARVEEPPIQDHVCATDEETGTEKDGFSKEPDDTGGNVVAVMQDIWRTEGLRGFWRGVVAGSIYYSAWACLFFGTYEIVAAVVV